jgi:mono/diheme cytochrome c family protein
LLAPEDQPQFGSRGPLNVFGPYSETEAAMDSARARSVPAYFRDADAASYVFVSGSTKKQGTSASVPPSLARLKVVATSGRPAYLRIDQLENTLVFENPGSPVITSNGSRDAIVWVLDQNARRSASLSGVDAPRPVLYALDAMTLKLLWKSGPGELSTSGKYNEPVFARGLVFVGTDRIQAFGPGAAALIRRRASSDAAGPTAIAPIAAPKPVRAAASLKPDGQAIYARRCAICHDQAQGNIPPRALIAARSRQSIVEALTLGAMREQAQGLSREEIEAVAGYLQ